MKVHLSFEIDTHLFLTLKIVRSEDRDMIHTLLNLEQPYQCVPFILVQLSSLSKVSRVRTVSPAALRSLNFFLL